MRRYLLNSPILTDWGRWRFDGPVGLEAARAFLAPGFESAVGHDGTAEVLSDVLGITVPMCRRAIHMTPGDRALVFRLLDRPEEGVVLDAPSLAGQRWAFGILVREG